MPSPAAVPMPFAVPDAGAGCTDSAERAGNACGTGGSGAAEGVRASRTRPGSRTADQACRTWSACRLSPGVPGLPESADPFAVGVPSVPQPPLTRLGSAVPDPIAPVPTPSTPYYFLAESSPYRPADACGRDADGDAARDAGLDSLAAAPFSPVPVEPPATYQFLDRPEAPSADRGIRRIRRALPASGYPAFDVTQVRRDFPILAERVNGKPLIWLDNAATTQKPQAVIDRLAHFYAARELQHPPRRARAGRPGHRRLRGRPQDGGAVHRRGVAQGHRVRPRRDRGHQPGGQELGKANIRRGDEIVISHLEHHANIVPWQQLISETGAVLRVIPVDDSGQILLDEYAKLLCPARRNSLR